MRASLVIGKRGVEAGKKVKCCVCDKDVSSSDSFVCDKVLRKPKLFEEPKTCDRRMCMGCVTCDLHNARDPERSRRHLCPEHAR